MAATTASVSPGSINRISGMVSGLDTDALIKSMMYLDTSKIDKLKQQKTSLNWEQDSIRDINTLTLSLKNTYASFSSPSTNLTSVSNFKINAVKVDSNSSVTVTANADAEVGTNVINSITSIAAGAKVTGNTKISNGSGISLTDSLKDLNLTTPLSFVTAEGDTVGHISFEINDVKFNFKETDSMQTIISAVNKSAANVTMSYSSLSDSINIKSKTLGSTSQLKIVNTDGNFFGANSATSISTGIVNNGTDAVLKINGYDVIRNTNSFTIDGLNYNLTGSTSTPINFSISTDIDSTVSKIQAFVKSYNDTLDKLNSKLNETKYPDYPPLTDAQKESMSETQIDKWENLAKSGNLNGNRNLETLINTMRSAFFNDVSGVGKNLTDIGFSTGSYAEKGKIYLDENVLRKALADNPDDVTSLFTKTSKSTNATTKSNESGLMARLTTAFSDFTASESLSTYTSKVAVIDRTVTDLNGLLTEKEDRYRAQFTRMEEALSKMNSQSSWLTQQLSSSTGG